MAKNRTVGGVVGDDSRNAAAIGKQLTEVKVSNIVKTIGIGIAEAQFKLDTTSMRIAQMMSGTKYDSGKKNEDGDPIIAEPHLVKFNGKNYSLLELGFTPTFYQFVDTIIEVKLSISMSSQESMSESKKTLSAKGGFVRLPIPVMAGGMKASTVSSSYSAKFQYSAEGSSLVRTKLVPVPPPAILEERIRAVMDKNPVKRDD